LAWTIEYDEGAVRDLKKLDHQVQREILNFMEKRVGQAEDPRSPARLSHYLPASARQAHRPRRRHRPSQHHLRTNQPGRGQIDDP